jgi:hypothetical protein
MHFIQTPTLACPDPGAIRRRTTHDGTRPRHLRFSPGTVAPTIDSNAHGILSARKTNRGNQHTGRRQTKQHIQTHRRLLSSPHPSKPLQRHPWLLIISNRHHRFTNFIIPPFSFQCPTGCEAAVVRLGVGPYRLVDGAWTNDGP